MRILLLHNRYRAEGGEERAVEEIAALLRSRGHEVEQLERTSAGLGRGQAASALLRGGHEPGEVADAVRRMRAEVVHVHNINPLFGWRSLAAAREAGARTVLHLHNFRLFCAISTCYRDGAVCHACRGRNTFPGIRYRCRGSLPEAFAYGVGIWRQQPRWFEYADAFVAVSEATRTQLVGFGLPPAKTTTLPNFVATDALAKSSRADVGEYALISGRLVEEKGFDTAIAACRRARVPLRVAGEGPDLTRLRGLASGPAGEVTFLGRLTEAALAETRRKAAMVLVPSRWEEPCPYSVLDAFADGVPVLASRLGGLPELVGPERALESGDHDAWTAAVSELWSDPELRCTTGTVGLDRARTTLGEDAYYDALLDLYEGRVPSATPG